MVMGPAGLRLDKTALARPSNNWKPQTRPLIREGAPNQRTCNCLQIMKIRINWSQVPDGLLTPRQTGRLTVGHNKTLTNSSWFALDFQPSVYTRLCKKTVYKTKISCNKTVRMIMFAAYWWTKSKPERENIRDLKLALAKRTIILVTKLQL
jgi:hypothetical protein